MPAMKKLIYPAAVIASTLLFLPACQQLQQLSDMQASTSQMNSTTAALSDKTSTVQSVLGYMEDLGRQGESLDLRNKLFTNLMNDQKVDQKLLDADLFMNAFEFQLWEENSISNANRRSLGCKIHRSIRWRWSALFWLRRKRHR